jgi:hypothetical protein
MAPDAELFSKNVSKNSCEPADYIVDDILKSSAFSIGSPGNDKKKLAK